jgi:acyl-coenzyme A synthetase/AMP-(fatty) acid ligase
MFDSVDMLLEDGLTGTFDTVANMYDERPAIITTAHSNIIDKIETLDSSSSEVTYLELQMYSQELANLLHHRFGVRRGNSVVLLCHGHAAAEV